MCTKMLPRNQDDIVPSGTQLMQESLDESHLHHWSHEVSVACCGSDCGRQFQSWLPPETHHNRILTIAMCVLPVLQNLQGCGFHHTVHNPDTSQIFLDHLICTHQILKTF